MLKPGNLSIFAEVHEMRGIPNVAILLPLFLAAGLTLTVGREAGAGQAPAAQAAPQPTPEGYMPRGFRPPTGKAPGMKVTDLGKGGRTFRINLTKGDDIMSALVEFAEKYHVKNAHFTGLGALDKGTFGWTDVERGLGQKKLELNQEAEVVSMVGSISVNAQGVPTVHAHGSVALSDGRVMGGHWFEAHVSIIAEIFVTEEEGAADAK